VGQNALIFVINEFLGQWAQGVMSATMAFGCHWSLIDTIFATSFERRVFWHQVRELLLNFLIVFSRLQIILQVLAVSGNVLAWVHGIMAIRKWPFLQEQRVWMMVSGRIATKIAARNFKKQNILGAIFGMSTAFLVLSSVPQVRRQLWNNFRRLHIFLNIIMVFAAFFHRCYYVLFGKLVNNCQFELCE
jgi:hypothetical protein